MTLQQDRPSTIDGDVVPRKPRFRRWLMKLRQDRDKQERMPRGDGPRYGGLVTGLVVVGLIVGPVITAKIVAPAVSVKSAVAQLQKDDHDRKQQAAAKTAAGFPLAVAQGVALQLAYECFTVSNQQTDDQSRRLMAAAGFHSCGWNGYGNGAADLVAVAPDQTWVSPDQQMAVVAMRVRLYNAPGWFVYAIPFVRHGATAVATAPGAVFGPASGMRQVFSQCHLSSSTSDQDALQRSAQRLVTSLIGANNADPGATVGGVVYGGFGPTVTAAQVQSVTVCQGRGAERLFSATVLLTGPVKGATYTVAYAFTAQPVNAGQANAYFAIDKWGPSPLAPEVSQ